jgi:hypothetical protein
MVGRMCSRKTYNTLGQWCSEGVEIFEGHQETGCTCNLRGSGGTVLLVPRPTAILHLRTEPKSPVESVIN